MNIFSFIVFSIIMIAAGIYGGMPIPALIVMLVICFFGWWRTSIRKNSGIDKIFKPIPEEPQKSKSVVITSDGEVIRTLNDGSVKSTLNIDKNNMGEDNIMWDFKLRKTRIIFLVSIPWVWFISYFHHYNFSRYFVEILIFTSPVWVYWIVIPLFLWIKKGK